MVITQKTELLSETSMLVPSMDTTMMVSPMETSKPNMEMLLPETKMVDLSEETNELMITMIPPWKGQRRPDKRDHLTQQPRAEIRTSCQLNHNHILQILKTIHMMPSQRKISEVQALQIDLADEAGIRPKETHELTSLQAGGKDVLGYTKQDQKKQVFQFQKTWDALLQRYKVEDNSWLNSIYKKVYTIGMRSTQLSESFNSDLKDFMRSSLDIIHFLKQFERAVGGKRYKELQAEYNARQKLPRLKMIHSSLLKHAAQRTIKCLNIKLPFLKKMENTLLKVLNVWDVKQIPAQYIMKRWAREAREIIVYDSDEKVVQNDTRVDATARYKNICSKAIKLAARSSDFEVTSNFVEQVIEEAYKKAEIFTSNIENQAILPLQSWNPSSYNIKWSEVTTPNLDN
ncbi:Protein FAR1-RELATED SEQUENCE [Arachis hypogaea]|nr:Protein FAR1-RELATED SEQUENCE [Arachis hypogaea]